MRRKQKRNTEAADIRYLSPWDIVPSPYQPRRTFDSAGLIELSQSIREHGLIQPIVVRPLEDGKYELIAGERRLRACKLAGFKDIKCCILEVATQEAALMTMVENLQRENLSFFDEAKGYALLMETYDMTQQEIAAMIGKQQSSIANKMRLLRLSPSLQQRITDMQLTERHARALLRLPNDDDRTTLLDLIDEKGLNVRQSEELVVDFLRKSTLETTKPQPTVNEPSQKIKRLHTDWRLVDNSLRSMVTSMRKSGVDIVYTTVDVGEAMEMRITVSKMNAQANINLG